MFTAIFNVCGVTLITGHLQKIDNRKLSKTWVSKAPDIARTENSNQHFLPGGATNSQNSPYISVWPLHYNEMIAKLDKTLRTAWIYSEQNMKKSQCTTRATINPRSINNKIIKCVHPITIFATDCMLGSQPNHGWQLCFPL